MHAFWGASLSLLASPSQQSNKLILVFVFACRFVHFLCLFERLGFALEVDSSFNSPVSSFVAVCCVRVCRVSSLYETRNSRCSVIRVFTTIFSGG